MKNLTLLLTIVATITMLSCSKVEVPQAHTAYELALERNFQLNTQIPTLDLLTHDQLMDWAVAKVETVQQLSVYSGTSFTEHYPTPTMLKGVDCAAAYSSATTACNWLLAGNVLASGIIAVGAGILTTPLGGGATGVALVAKDVNNYVQCKNAAITARDNCIQAQIK